MCQFEGSHQNMFRTGYDYIVPNRTSDLFAFCAKQDGKVISLNDKGVIVEYVDGTQKGVNLGRQYGKAEGSTYPFDIIAIVKAGQTFKKGDPIAYNTSFFEVDYLDPTKIVMKFSKVVKTALIETAQTFEDSSSISSKLSKQLASKTTKIKSFTVSFKQNVLNVVKAGQAINPKDILLTIEDEITSSNNNFDSNALSTLQKLSKQSPKAKLIGYIDKVEVLYHGDKEDMNDSLKALADASDKLLAQECRSTGKAVITGQVNEDYRVAGKPLILDNAEIRVYITISTKASVGDKASFASQMKSVHGEVMNYKVTTETGEEIDAFFSFRSIYKRIVTSPIVIGTTITLLKIAAKKVVEAYKS